MTPTVSPKLMLILSTYRVVLHPSYLQNFFSFIIFIKERQFYNFLRNKAELLEATVGGAKEWRALKALFIKCSSTKTLEKLSFLPQITNCIHCLRNAVFFGKLNEVIFPSQPKTHFFRDILPELAPFRMKHVDGCAVAFALVDTFMGAFFREKCPYKESHPCLHHEEPRSELIVLWSYENTFCAQRKQK